MIIEMQRKQPWNAVVTLAATDSTKILKAAPGAGKSLVLTKWSYRSITSAAQILDLTDGTTVIDKLPASITAGTMHDGPVLEKGFKLPKDTALSATPAAAGPAGIWVVEGYIEG